MKTATIILSLVLWLSVLTPEDVRAEGSSYSLLNADDGTPVIDSLNYLGAVLNLAELPPRLTIVDSVFDAAVGSVDFFHNGSRIRTENVSPYALGGDYPPGVFVPYDLPIGPNTVRTVYYQLSDRRGAVLGEASIQFDVIHVEPVDLGVTPSPIMATVPAGGQSTTSFQITVGEIEFDYELVILSSPPFWAWYPETLHEGANTIRLRADNLPPGDYIADPVVMELRARDLPFRQTMSFGLIMTVEDSNAVFASGFTFVDADTDTDWSASLFGPSSLNLFDLPPVYGIRVDTYPAVVGSVVVEHSFQPNLADLPAFPPSLVRVENIAPYSLPGDYPSGDYAGVPRQTGWLWIRATPYLEAHGRGPAGTPLELLVYIYPN